MVCLKLTKEMPNCTWHICCITTTANPFDLTGCLLNYSSESEFHLSVTHISLNINVGENSLEWLEPASSYIIHSTGQLSELQVVTAYAHPLPVKSQANNSKHIYLLLLK